MESASIAPKSLALPKCLFRVTHYVQSSVSQPKGLRIAKNFQAIEIVTGGRGWVLERDDYVEVRKGDFLWHEGSDHAIGRSDPDDPYSCLAFYFEMPRGVRRTVPRFLFWQDLERLPALTEEAVQLFVDERISREILSFYFYGFLLKEATLSLQHRKVDTLPQPIRKLMHHIETRYANRLDLDELASVSGWSKAHLYERVRDTLETTPHAMLIARRLRAARELLSTTSLPLKQIAAECGFTHTSALCFHFRRSMGITPDSFRRRSYTN